MLCRIYIRIVSVLYVFYVNISYLISCFIIITSSFWISFERIAVRKHKQLARQFILLLFFIYHLTNKNNKNNLVTQIILLLFILNVNETRELLYLESRLNASSSDLWLPHFSDRIYCLKRKWTPIKVPFGCLWTIVYLN